MRLYSNNAGSHLTLFLTLFSPSTDTEFRRIDLKPVGGVFFQQVDSTMIAERLMQ